MTTAVLTARPKDAIFNMTCLNQEDIVQRNSVNRRGLAGSDVKTTGVLTYNSGVEFLAGLGRRGAFQMENIWK